MQKLPIWLLVVALFAAVALAPFAIVNAQPSPGKVFHVSGQGMPASLTSPTSDENRPTNRSLLLDTLVIANNSGAQQTVTLQDCQTTPFKFFNGAPIPAGTTWVLSFVNGIRFQGCLQWSASSTSVMGTLVGE